MILLSRCANLETHARQVAAAGRGCVFRRPLEAYAELIPEDMPVQTKAETHGAGRDNFRRRHWFGRFRRKTCIVSRSKKMADLTVGLFARFHHGGGFDQIVQLFGCH
jgi:hypothetical protein